MPPSLPGPLATFTTSLPLAPWSPNLGHRGARGIHGKIVTRETKQEHITHTHLGCKQMSCQLLNAWKLLFVSPPPVTSSPVYAVVPWAPFPPQIFLNLLLNSVHLQFRGWRSSPPALPSCPPVRPAPRSTAPCRRCNRFPYVFLWWRRSGVQPAPGLTTPLA